MHTINGQQKYDVILARMAANFGSSIIINLPTKAAVSVFALGMFWHNTRKTRYSDIFILPPERDT